MNPYIFENVNVNYWNFRLNGETIPTVAYKPDFSKPRGETMLLYQNLLDVVGVARENTLMDITPEDFCSNLTLFALDLTGHGCNNFKVHLATSGTLGVNGSLEKPTEKVWQLVKFLTYPKCLSVDGEKKCKVEDMY